MRNGTVILLYSNAIKHLACSNTPQCQSRSEIWPLALEEIKESEKISKILEQTLQYWTL